MVPLSTRFGDAGLLQVGVSKFPTIGPLIELSIAITETLTRVN